MSATLRLIVAAAMLQAASSARDVPRRALLDSEPDSYIIAHGARSHMMATRGDRIARRRTRDLADLANPAEKAVWRPPAHAANARSIWAPEPHRLSGHRYIYSTANDSDHDDDAHRGALVLEHCAPDPLAWRWVCRGRINTRLP